MKGARVPEKNNERLLSELKERYPDKCLPLQRIFKQIHRGNHIFISTACGKPQYLVKELIRFVDENPKALVDTEIFHLWTLGVAPFAEEKFKSNFRLNTFFIGDNTRDAVNQGLADYTPVFLSHVPDLFNQGFERMDVALIQTSLPDMQGYVSLGVSVDIVKAAVEKTKIVIAQLNPQMPRVHGDSFVHIRDINYIIPYDEPLIEYHSTVTDDIASKIGSYVASIVQDKDTIQVGYGSMPNAILESLGDKKHLGVHTELISDGIVALMRSGVIDNSCKSIDRGKTVASFCMGSQDTYEFINDNPAIAFRAIDYTNDPLIIAGQKNMVAINAALQIDLTGQSTSESIGSTFYSGIGGHADFMRGALLAPGGKTILALRSTSNDGKHSRIVARLDTGAGVSLTRGDIQYVVTEYGIAYLHGKNIRLRAMSLIAIAHPKFRPALILEAKECGLIYQDQAFIPGERGNYPEFLETQRSTSNGEQLLLRPVQISDEALIKDFFYSLSDQSMYRRFMSVRTDMPHERLQQFVVIDYTREMVILAILEDENHQQNIVGIGQYGIDDTSLVAEVAVVVRDETQDCGIGSELLSYLTMIAKRQGLLGFTAEVLVENNSMMHLFEQGGFDVEKHREEGAYELKLAFKESL